MLQSGADVTGIGDEEVAFGQGREIAVIVPNLRANPWVDTQTLEKSQPYEIEVVVAPACNEVRLDPSRVEIHPAVLAARSRQSPLTRVCVGSSAVRSAITEVILCLRAASARLKATCLLLPIRDT